MVKMNLEVCLWSYASNRGRVCMGPSHPRKQWEVAGSMCTAPFTSLANNLPSRG
jgi:hypothetical protein